MKTLPIAYRITLGILLPGSLGVLLILYFTFTQISESYLLKVINFEAIFILILLVISLIIGNIVEAIRYITIDLLFNRIFYGKNSSSYSSKMQTEADLRFYELVYDTSYAPYQFYLNTFVVLLLALIYSHFSSATQVNGGIKLIVCILLMFLLAAAIRATRGAANRIKYRFNYDQTKENAATELQGWARPSFYTYTSTATSTTTH